MDNHVKPNIYIIMLLRKAVIATVEFFLSHPCSENHPIKKAAKTNPIR